MGGLPPLWMRPTTTGSYHRRGTSTSKGPPNSLVTATTNLPSHSCEETTHSHCIYEGVVTGLGSFFLFLFLHSALLTPPLASPFTSHGPPLFPPFFPPPPAPFIPSLPIHLSYLVTVLIDDYMYC